jgi:cell division protein FtsI/penicillin-binding protein 2
MLFLLGIILMLFGILAYRLTYLMLFPEESRLGSVSRTRTFFDTTAARRGNIYDCNGVALAITVPTLEVGVDPRALLGKDVQATMAVLADQLGISVESIMERWRERLETIPHLRWIQLADGISESTYRRILNLKLPGVYGNRKFQRFYPQGSSACHVIGFVNRESIACCGVEKFADFFLSGQDGWIISEKDGKRQELVQYRSRNIPAVDGCDVYLNLNIAIQKIVENELGQIMENFHPKFAVAIITEAKSGKLLALTCIPNYDLNNYGQFPMDCMRNRAIADVYEPGSVFKIVPACAGLEEGIIRPQTTFDCSRPFYEYGGKKYSLPKDHSAFGTLTLIEILRQSSNRGSAQIAIQLGKERFYSYVRAFGFGEKAGYGFDGELAGILRPPHLWDGLTITRMPMGHAIGVTPMQMHMAMSVLASGGYLLTPLVLGKVATLNGDLPRGGNDMLLKPIIRRQVLGKQTVQSIRSIMENSKYSNEFPFSISFKTGTTQKIIDGRYVHDRHIASCSGFFPSRDPRYVITVVIDSPASDGSIAWGSRYAQPSFQRIALELFRYMSTQ